MTDYRPEIDGLRAIAVLAVVLFHFDVPGFSGGFVGVDIFFVISGYLIGGLLWSELSATGKIELRAFFMRRIRRLAPAFLAMLAACLLAGWFILLPFEFGELANETIASIAYLSNIYFWQEAGYFDVLGEERVLLHTWSLAVEEQFYLFLPLILILFFRVKGVAVWLFVTMLVFSFGAFGVLAPLAPDTAFYLLPFRLWELLAGVLLAIRFQQNSAASPRGTFVSWVGLVAIAISIVALSPSSHYPGVLSALPVLGACLIIASGREENFVNRLLSIPIMRGMGLISYSLYLWHWPIITLSRYISGNDLPFWLKGILFLTSILLAIISYRFIETPFRKKTVNSKKLLGAYFTGSLAALGISVLIILNAGFIERFDRAYWPFIRAAQDTRQDVSRCQFSEGGAFKGIETCAIGPDGPPKLLIWGDSHAIAYRMGIERIANLTNTPALIAYRASCPPLNNISKRDNVNSRFEELACINFNQAVMQGLQDSESIDTVLLVGRWAYYATGQGIGRDTHNKVVLFRPEDDAAHPPSQAQIFESAFLETRDLLKRVGVDVFLLRQTPEIEYFSAREVARDLVFGREEIERVENETAMTDLAILEERNRIVDDLFRRLDIPVLDIWPSLCSASACRAVLDGIVYYADNNHLTNRGALAISNVFLPAFKSAE